jgi:hypothetical protein
MLDSGLECGNWLRRVKGDWFGGPIKIKKLDR